MRESKQGDRANRPHAAPLPTTLHTVTHHTLSCLPSLPTFIVNICQWNWPCNAFNELYIQQRLLAHIRRNDNRNEAFLRGPLIKLLFYAKVAAAEAGEGWGGGGGGR
jgi:hypothetical protein